MRPFNLKAADKTSLVRACCESRGLKTLSETLSLTLSKTGEKLPMRDKVFDKVFDKEGQKGLLQQALARQPRVSRFEIEIDRAREGIGVSIVEILGGGRLTSPR